MPDLNDLEDEHRALQEMHDVEHRKEVDLENLMRDRLPRHSSFTRCEGCGCSFRPPLEGRPSCPLCDHTNAGALWMPEERDD